MTPPQTAEAVKPGYVLSKKCPHCGSRYSRVLRKRAWLTYIWRRRECLKGHRFTTQES
jgi:transcriptional regulator NrdR family protein